MPLAASELAFLLGLSHACACTADVVTRGQSRLQSTLCQAILSLFWKAVRVMEHMWTVWEWWLCP